LPILVSERVPVRAQSRASVLPWKLPWAFPLLVCTWSLAAGCGSASAPLTTATVAPPTLTPEITAITEKLLGPDGKVVLSGDLAHNGHQQILVVNALPQSPGGPASSITFRRAAVIEQEGAKWTEVLRCDEYLKNPNGYLRGTPLLPVLAGWRLRWNPSIGIRAQELDFTPLQASGAAPTVAVRWNPAVSRYQSLDAANREFLGEIAALETPASELR
jgi:hypothetical protein